MNYDDTVEKMECKSQTMALETFTRFSELVPEIRIKIWQCAYFQEGPRTVEIANAANSMRLQGAM